VKVRLWSRIAFLILATCLFQTAKFIAVVPAVPAGACLYALDSTADDAFPNAGTHLVCPECSVVSESSAGKEIDLERSSILFLENPALYSSGELCAGAMLTNYRETFADGFRTRLDSALQLPERRNA